MSIEFQAAVDAALKALEGIETAPDKIRFDAAIIVKAILSGSDDNALAKFVEGASEDSVKWEALAYACAHEIRNGKPLPAILAEWSAQSLTGAIQRSARLKSQSRSLPGDYIVRNLYIHDAVRELVSQGIQPTRSETTNSINACEAVAEALRIIGIPVTSYSKVKAIYERIHRQQQDAGLLRLLVSQLERRVRTAGV